MTKLERYFSLRLHVEEKNQQYEKSDKVISYLQSRFKSM